MLHYFPYRCLIEHVNNTRQSIIVTRMSDFFELLVKNNQENTIKDVTNSCK